MDLAYRASRNSRLLGALLIATIALMSIFAVRWHRKEDLRAMIVSCYDRRLGKSTTCRNESLWKLLNSPDYLRYGDIQSFRVDNLFLSLDTHVWTAELTVKRSTKLTKETITGVDNSVQGKVQVSN